MPAYTVKDKYIIYKGRKIAESKYRILLSNEIISLFGQYPYNANQTAQIIQHCIAYYVTEFKKIIENESSYMFYKNAFWLHEQVSDLMHNYDLDELRDGLTGSYLAVYRRILKLVIEAGCDVEMISGEKLDGKFISRAETILDDLLFLGEMLLLCVNWYAEQDMVEDLAEITFDSENLYEFRRKYHYDLVFEHMAKQHGVQVTKHVIDPNAFTDFVSILKKAFDIDFEDVKYILERVHEEHCLVRGDVVAIGKEGFIENLHHCFGVTLEAATTFFTGLLLNKGNKMDLFDLALRPYNLNRFLYRPIISWQVNGREFWVCGMNSWSESFNALTTNAIPWGKAPPEWMANKIFKQYVNRKKDEHTTWLENNVEAILTSKGLMFDRNIKKLKSDNGVYDLETKDLGEIDFIIVSEHTKKVLITECKHLLGRYDAVSQKNDYSAFSDVSNPKSYNTTMTKKVGWFKSNKAILQQHFLNRYNKSLQLDNYEIEGIFVINTPTLYMYNSPYRIYTVNQIEEVLDGVFTDPAFMLLDDRDDAIGIQRINYPFLRKPSLANFSKKPKDLG